MFCPISAPPRFDFMGFFQGYFDESGKHQTNRVVSFCGLVDCDWDGFASAWTYQLRKNRIPALHISKDSLKATTKQLKMYRQFVRAIADNVESAFGMAVDVTAFNAMHKVFRRQFRDDAHYLVFHNVLRDVIKYVSLHPEPSVAIICDDEPSKACDCYKHFDVMRQNVKQPENRRVLKSVAFADAKFYLQLQAADLFSWVSRAECLYRFFGEDYSLRELHHEFNLMTPERKITYATAFWDAEHVAKVNQLTISHLGPKALKKAEDRMKV